MSNSSELESPPRVLFFGMPGAFSAPPLAALLDAGIEVSAVILPVNPLQGAASASIERHEVPTRTRTILPLAHSSLHTNIVQIAAKHSIPIWRVSRLSDALTHATLAGYEPDLICVACFSRLLPASLLHLPRLGCLNVHPSLLPANRGPEPLFWTFREHAHETGVSIHLMNENMDSGPIVLQERIEVLEGISYEQLEERCARLGGDLLARAAWQLYRGEVELIEQDDTQSSYHRFPGEDDFIVHVDQWDARDVYNFIQGVGHWDAPIRIEAPGHEWNAFEVRNCYSYSLEPMPGQSRMIVEDGAFLIRCARGWVRVV
ncbi:methionyl-tRNA formyltransferase [Ktedonospora formicarum]|uniref:methionyl-tRNA formyltransferase n=1 Tax=Ktedonospora formicarum TaxID=2778364 RepID=A0A8J3I1Q1_9CHLR|nr:methionyl-tRNA formyltransferase [Ktedonospora formicarum]GHO48407.1 formyl transferase [Ktedonospora formicarum]